MIVARDFRLTPSQVRTLPNRDVLELLAMYRLDAERANRKPTFKRKG